MNLKPPKFELDVAFSHMIQSYRFGDPAIAANFPCYFNFDREFTSYETCCVFRKRMARMNREGQTCLLNVTETTQFGDKLLGCCGFIRVNRIAKEAHLVYLFHENCYVQWKSILSTILKLAKNKKYELRSLNCHVFDQNLEAKANALLKELKFFEIYYDDRRNEDDSIQLRVDLSIEDSTQEVHESISSSLVYAIPLTQPYTPSLPKTPLICSDCNRSFIPILRKDGLYHPRCEECLYFLQANNPPIGQISNAIDHALTYDARYQQRQMVQAPSVTNIHVDDPTLQEDTGDKVCSYWLRGVCRFGEHCRFKHLEEEGPDELKTGADIEIDAEITEKDEHVCTSCKAVVETIGPTVHAPKAPSELDEDYKVAVWDLVDVINTAYPQWLVQLKFQPEYCRSRCDQTAARNHSLEISKTSSSKNQMSSPDSTTKFPSPIYDKTNENHITKTVGINKMETRGQDTEPSDIQPELCINTSSTDLEEIRQEANCDSDNECIRELMAPELFSAQMVEIIMGTRDHLKHTLDTPQKIIDTLGMAPASQSLFSLVDLNREVASQYRRIKNELLFNYHQQQLFFQQQQQQHVLLMTAGAGLPMNMSISSPNPVPQLIIPSIPAVASVQHQKVPPCYGPRYSQAHVSLYAPSPSYPAIAAPPDHTSINAMNYPNSPYIQTGPPMVAFQQGKMADAPYGALYGAKQRTPPHFVRSGSSERQGVARYTGCSSMRRNFGSSPRSFRDNNFPRARPYSSNSSVGREAEEMHCKRDEEGGGEAKSKEVAAISKESLASEVEVPLASKVAE